MEANMTPIKQCIMTVSNLIRSATKGYKVIEFNLTPLIQIRRMACSLNILQLVRQIWHLRAI